MGPFGRLVSELGACVSTGPSTESCRALPCDFVDDIGLGAAASFKGIVYLAHQSIR